MLFIDKYRIESARLKGRDYSQPGQYFVTICTQSHENYFGRLQNEKIELNDIGKIVKEEWIKTGKIRKNIIIDEFVIMPNHIHGIIIITENKQNAKSNKQTIQKIQNKLYDNYKNLNNDETNLHNVETTRRVVSTNIIEQAIDTENKSVNDINQCFENKKRIFKPNGPKSGSIGAIIGQFKSIVSKRSKQFIKENDKTIWQRNYYEHIIRDDTELNKIRLYIKNNPGNWLNDKYH